jgi:hypothetical protein
MATSGNFRNISKKCASLFMKAGTDKNKVGLPNNSQCCDGVSLKIKLVTIRQI